LRVRKREKHLWNTSAGKDYTIRFVLAICCFVRVSMLSGSICACYYENPPLLLLPVLLLAPCESLPGTWMFGLFLVDDVATSYNTNDFTIASTGTSNPREQSHPRNHGNRNRSLPEITYLPYFMDLLPLGRPASPGTYHHCFVYPFIPGVGLDRYRFGSAGKQIVLRQSCVITRPSIHHAMPEWRAPL
jgi:hypothetical protein